MIKIAFYKGIQIVALSLFVLLGLGCTANESKVYEGKVVDEVGRPISDVMVRVCYVGWGWSENGGVVWDKVYCSEAAVTNESGFYRVKFTAPSSAYLRARKAGWLQAEDFLAKEKRIVLTSTTDYLRRQMAKEEKKERDFRKRKPDESDTDYYCRVIAKRSGRVELIYHGRRVKILQILMHDDGLLFAVAGPYDRVQSIADEIIIRETVLSGGKPLVASFVAMPGNITCGSNIYFIHAEAHGVAHFPEYMDKVVASLPSIQAGFPMRIWSLP